MRKEAVVCITQESQRTSGDEILRLYLSHFTPQSSRQPINNVLRKFTTPVKFTNSKKIHVISKIKIYTIEVDENRFIRILLSLNNKPL